MKYVIDLEEFHKGLQRLIAAAGRGGICLHFVVEELLRYADTLSDAAA